MLVLGALLPLIGLASAGAAEAPWRLEEVASLDGDAHRFAKVTALAFGASGDLLLLDGQGDEVLIFDLARGGSPRRIGGSGQGPGELSDPRLLTAFSDGGFAVLDARSANRISRFAADGAFVDSERLPGMLERAVIRRIEGAGKDVFALRVPAAVQLPGRTQVLFPQLVRVSERGDERLVYEYTELQVEPLRLGDPASALRMYVNPRPIFAVLDGGRLAIGRADRYDVSIVDADGAEIAALRRDIEPVPITDQLKERFMAEMPEHLRSHPIEWGESMPLIAGILPGPENAVMVIRGRNGEPVLDLFSASYEFVAEIDLPRGFQPLAARAGLIAGRVITEAHEEAVKVYRVQSPSD